MKNFGVCGMIKNIATRLGSYSDHPEPRCSLAGKTALMVAFNQPFYPLYMHAIVGPAAWPAWLTLLTTPVFLAVPALAKRHSLAGRVLLPLVGVANTTFCVKLFGAASGVELFLIPCALLGTILFRPDERLKAAIVAALPFITYLFIDAHLGRPLMLTSDYSSLVALNGMSAAALIAVIGLFCSALLAAQDVCAPDSGMTSPSARCGCWGVSATARSSRRRRGLWQK